ncbi:MAG: M24 family metallopeptidase [Thermomicrobiales bacterium]
MIDGKLSPLFAPERLFAAMDAADCDAVVAHTRRNYFYLSSVDILDYAIDPDTANFVLVPRDSAQPAMMTIPMSEALQLRDVPTWITHRILCGRFYVKNGPDLGSVQVPDAWEGLIEALRSGGFSERRVGFEMEHMPVTLYRRLIEAFPRLQIVDASPLFRHVRKVKTAEEIRRIRIACAITEQAIADVIPHVRPGYTDMDVSQAIGANIAAHGAEVLYVQVGTDATAGLGLPAGRRLDTGDVVRLDVAGIYQGYTSDLGRGFAIGTATVEQQRLYRVAYQALQAGITAVRSGCSIGDVFHAAMSEWAGAGFPEVRRHHVGHGVGLQAHEPPLIKPDADEATIPGMVLAVEVPCYIYRVGGFAPEDILVVGETDNTQFTSAPSELPVVG